MEGGGLYLNIVVASSLTFCVKRKKDFFNWEKGYKYDNYGD